MAQLVKIVNWEDGSNARYDVSQMDAVGDGRYTVDGYYFDSEGRPLSAGVPGDGPGQWTNGLPGARGGTGPGGGGGVSGSSGGGDPISSPYYQQVLAAVNANAAASAAARRAAIQRALIAYGLVPEGFEDKYGDVDALTRELAKKNTDTGISTYARLLQARKDAINQFVDQLSARGLRRSGAKGYGLRMNQLAYDQQQADALSALMGGIGEQYSAFAQGEYQRQLQLADALANAMTSWTGGGSNSTAGAKSWIDSALRAGMGNRNRSLITEWPESRPSYGTRNWPGFQPS